MVHHNVHSKNDHDDDDGNDDDDGDDGTDLQDVVDDGGKDNINDKDHNRTLLVTSIFLYEDKMWCRYYVSSGMDGGQVALFVYLFVFVFFFFLL